VFRTAVCGWCEEQFGYEFHIGRPRRYCFQCEPKGYQVVKVRGRLKLRVRRSQPVHSEAMGSWYADWIARFSTDEAS
jgi:hypothetical protein